MRKFTALMPPPTSARPGRNEPCHCGSGRKYKHCCLEKDDVQAAAARAEAAAAAATESSEAPTSVPTRAPKHQTHQPWKAATSRGFVSRARMPRKVGGSGAPRLRDRIRQDAVDADRRKQQRGAAEGREHPREKERSPHAGLAVLIHGPHAARRRVSRVVATHFTTALARQRLTRRPCACTLRALR